MSFEALLADLAALHSQPPEEAMNKSMPAADDEKVAAAAADSGVDVDNAAPEGDKAPAAAPEAGVANDDESAEGEGEGEGSPDGDDDDEVMGKSFSLFDEHGDPVEAIDGTAMVKSLVARIDGQETSMTKALGLAVDLVKSQAAALHEQRVELASQGGLIKSLQEQVASLANTGRGRASTVSVAEKPATGQLAKSEPEGLSGKEFMAKAQSAFEAGRITGRDVAIAETSLQKGLAVPAGIVQRVLK